MILIKNTERLLKGVSKGRSVLKVGNKNENDVVWQLLKNIFVMSSSTFL
jgi:hypothetical protein